MPTNALQWLFWQEELSSLSRDLSQSLSILLLLEIPPANCTHLYFYINNHVLTCAIWSKDLRLLSKKKKLILLLLKNCRNSHRYDACRFAVSG